MTDGFWCRPHSAAHVLSRCRHHRTLKQIQQAAMVAQKHTDLHWLQNPKTNLRLSLMTTFLDTYHLFFYCKTCLELRAPKAHFPRAATVEIINISSTIHHANHCTRQLSAGYEYCFLSNAEDKYFLNVKHWNVSTNQFTRIVCIDCHTNIREQLRDQAQCFPTLVEPCRCVFF